MKIAIGSDHAGFKLKEAVKAYLERKKIDYKDFGTKDETSVDYPDYGEDVALGVAKKKFDKGILICGTGIGMSIVVNKFPGIRGALVHDMFTAKMSRAHNDANVLVMGSRILKKDQALKIVGVWLKMKFEDGRHSKRIGKIKQIERRFKCTL